MFDERGEIIGTIYKDLVNSGKITYDGLISLCNKVWKKPSNFMVIDMSKDKKYSSQTKS